MRRRAIAEVEAERVAARRLFAAGPIPTWLVDRASGRILDVNDAAVARYGYSRDEFLAMRLDDLRSPTDGDRPAGPSKDTHHRSRDGSLVYVKLDARDLTLDGRLLSLVSATDLTAERQAQQGRAQLAAIVEAAEDAIVGSSLDGTIRTWNRGAERLYGHSADEAIGRSIAMTFPPDQLEEVHARLARIAKGEAILGLETERLTRDGRGPMVSVSIAPIRDDSGRIIGASGIARDIGQRLAAEAKIAFQAHLLDEVEAAVVASDLTGRVIYWNRHAEKMLGWTADEASAIDARTLVGGDAEASREIYDAILQTGRWRGEITLFGKDGGPVSVFSSNSLMRDELGQPIAVVGVMVDVSERHRLEHALRETVEHLQAVVNGTTDAIFLQDLETRFLVANEATARFIGRSVTEVLGRTARDLLPPSAADEFDAAERAAIADGVPVTREQDFTVDGVRTVWQTTLGPYRNDADQIVGVFGVARDVTVQRTAEESLARSQALLAAAETIANLGSYEIDLANGAVRWSEQLHRMAPLDPPDRELSYEVFLGTVHPDDRARVRATIEDAIGHGIDHAYEFRVPQPDGTERVLSCQARVVADVDGRPIRIFGTAQDVTDTRRLEEEFRQAQKMEAVGRLAGGIAHDFNNALTAILGYTQILRDSLAEGAEAEWVDQIDGAARHAAGLTRQLLAFSRRQILQPKVFDVVALVNELAPILRRLIGEDIDLVVSAEPGTGRVSADPGQLQQVLINLAVNARDAMPHGGRLTISLADEDINAQAAGIAPGPYIRLAVDDTGEGMDDATKGRIFEPFFTTKEVGKGTGLGLAMVHGFVTQSGGHISFDSERDGGTRFRILLPRVEAEVEPTHDETPEPETADAGGLILLVEDEPMVRELTRLTLETHGYAVMEATNADEAIIALDRMPGIDLVISDVVMPGSGGGELAEAMKSRGSRIPIIFMSGYPRDAVVANGISHLEYTYLAKPFSPSQLLATVRDKLTGDRPAAPVARRARSRARSKQLSTAAVP